MTRATRHLYVHVPFCARRCSYCDFAIAVRSRTPVDEYLLALEREIDQWMSGNGVQADSTHLTAQWSLDTVYFGGGTPSRLGDGIAHALDLIRSRATIAPSAEITLEANPDDVSLDVARAWRNAGINRVSLGVQSFDDAVLTWMHRTHSANQAESAVRILREAGIDNVSIDLIFSLPESLNRDWQRDVQRGIALQPSHVSLYGLTVEPHTPLARWRERGEITEATEDRYEADFLYAHEALITAGFDHYEVSNYGRPSTPSAHNSSYWRNVPYAALGPGAHRFDGTTRSWNVAQYTEWSNRLSAGQSPVAGSEILTLENRTAERIYLGLRTNTGLQASDQELETARRWVTEGWATISDRTIVLTPTGWLRLDALAASLTVAESR